MLRSGIGNSLYTRVSLYANRTSHRNNPWRHPLLRSVGASLFEGQLQCFNGPENVSDIFLVLALCAAFDRLPRQGLLSIAPASRPGCGMRAPSLPCCCPPEPAGGTSMRRVSPARACYPQCFCVCRFAASSVSWRLRAIRSALRRRRCIFVMASCPNPFAQLGLVDDCGRLRHSCGHLRPHRIARRSQMLAAMCRLSRPSVPFASRQPDRLPQTIQAGRARLSPRSILASGAP
jgi:hypothetical protein